MATATLDAGSSRASAAPRTPNPIRVRKMGFDFSEVPRHWFFDSAWATHMANGLNLVFPAGERFFIRSVKHYLDHIADDPELVARCRSFFGQEGSHGHEHERAFRVLEEQGFDVETWLRWYEQSAFEKVEKRAPAHLRLATTAALEHLTATLAEEGLATDELDHAHPVMRDMLRWHACEEIEHKSVAFDVLQRVDKRYWVRIAGMVIGLTCLMYYWRSAAKMLMEQEGITKAEAKQAKKEARARGQNKGFLWRGLLAYLRPGFHPDDHDNYGLARDYLTKIGRLDG